MYICLYMHIHIYIHIYKYTCTLQGQTSRPGSADSPTNASGGPEDSAKDDPEETKKDKALLPISRPRLPPLTCPPPAPFLTPPRTFPHVISPLLASCSCVCIIIQVCSLGSMHRNIAPKYCNNTNICSISVQYFECCTISVRDSGVVTK